MANRRYIVELFKNITRENLSQRIQEGWDISQCPEMEFMKACAAYEALENWEQDEIKADIQTLSVEDLLYVIAEQREDLFDEIELLLIRKVPVLTWLEYQISLVPTVITAFEEHISEVNHCVNPNTSHRIRRN